MPRRYDRARHDELIAEEARLSQRIDTLRQQLHDTVESDTPFDGEVQRTYAMRSDEYLRLRAERQDVRGDIRDMEHSEPARVQARQSSMLTRFLRRGFNGLEQSEREQFESQPDGDMLNDPSFVQMGGLGCEGLSIRAATTSDAASGQELVEETVVPDVVERLADFGGLARLANRIMTATGNELRYPQADNSTAKGEILGSQDTAVTPEDLAAFGVVTFNARTCSSKPISITREMLVDSIIDVGGYAERQAVRRMGRAWDAEFTDEGDGAGTRSRSLKNSVEVGHKQDTADTLVYTDLVDLIFSVNRAYRAGMERGEGGWEAEPGTVGFLVTDSAEKAFMKLKDGEDRPLWIPSIRDGAPDRILRYPYEVTSAIDGDHESDADTPYTWFGHFGYYGIRTVGSVEIFRFFDSRTAQKNAIEILGFSRRDARAMGAQGGGAAGTTEAIKSLTAK